MYHVEMNFSVLFSYIYDFEFPRCLDCDMFGGTMLGSGEVRGRA